MPLGKRQRRILLALGLVVAGLLALWFSLPIWFPWVLRPVARRSGAQFARYEREGYGAFSLYGFSYTNQSVRFTAQRIEGITPTLWLWRLGWKSERSWPPFLSLNNWQVESQPSSKPASSVYTQAQGLTSDLHFLQRWVPQAALSNGTVRVQKQEVKIPALTWLRGKLWAKIQAPELEAVLTGNLGTTQPYRLQLSSDSLHLKASVEVSTNAAGLTVQSTNLWWNNPVELQAHFGRTGQLPEQARLQAHHFELPARLLELPEYGAIQGSLTAHWLNGHFTLDLSAEAHPVAAEENLPPLNLELHARGNTNRTVIETAVLSSPWLQAELSRELEVHFTGQLLREPASLRLRADLTRQPWLALQGILKGEATFIPATGRFPEAGFQLSGAEVGTAQLKAKSFQIEGRLDWPALTVTNIVATFPDGSQASARGQAELRKRRVESAQFAFNGPLAQRWLPPGYSCQDLTVAGQVHGAFTNLSHSGHLALTNLVSPELRPLNLTLDWQGRQQNLSQAHLQVSAGRARLALAGALEFSQGGGELRLDALTLSQSGQALLRLEQPTRLSLHQAVAHTNVWQAQLSPFRWAGTAGELQAQATVDWPRSGNATVSVRGLRPELAQDFLKASLPAVEVRVLDAAAAWTHGPVKFALEAAVQETGLTNATQGTNRPVAPSQLSTLQMGGGWSITGDSTGISIHKLELTSQTAPVANFHGFVPLTLTPGAPEGLVQVEPNGPLNLRGVLQSHGVLWDKVTAWTGLRLQSPQLRLEISGTPKAPQGQLQLQARQLELTKIKEPPLPTLTDLRLELQLDRQQARLINCQVLLQGQPATLTAEVPLGEAFWADLKHQKLPNWEKASAHLEMAHAELAAFASLYPELLTPQGDLEVNVLLLPGAKLEGYLAVQRARTRPLPSVGPVRDINLRLLFRQRQVEMAEATANMGGSIVELSGHADLGDLNWLKHGAPPFSFTLFGTNVPFVRRPEAVIRGDLLLNTTKTNGEPPLISGTVRLHDSFFLSDLAALIPGKIEVPSQRPPYFSVTNEPLADWRLAVQVNGDRFLRVRTTVFNGEVSANLNLEGPLKNPIALGSLKIDSGLVQFPFGSLDVKQGFVTLTRENPYHPQLVVTATSKQFGYDIQMRVSGTVDAPVIQFTSNPPLSSEQILLLLTAGELPPGTFTLTTQQRAQTVATFLARDLLNKLGFGGTGEQRLTIRSGEEITETGKPTYSIEFKLTDRWSLIGEYDRFGDYNAGVKWRIYSK